jgi:hypothetical protein
MKTAEQFLKDNAPQTYQHLKDNDNLLSVVLGVMKKYVRYKRKNPAKISFGAQLPIRGCFVWTDENKTDAKFVPDENGNCYVSFIVKEQ